MAAKKMFDDLQNLTGFYLDHITKEQEKNKTSLSEAVLAGWAHRLSSDGKDERALEMYEWMEEKNMKFSPSQFAHFVELMGKIKGHGASNDLFKKLDPHFHKMDSGELKNWLPYKKILGLENQESLNNTLAKLEDDLASSKEDSASASSEEDSTLAFDEEDSALAFDEEDSASSEEDLENAGRMTLEWRRHYAKPLPGRLEWREHYGKPHPGSLAWRERNRQPHKRTM